MFDTVVLRALDNIAFGYWRFKPKLPLKVRSGIEQQLGIIKPSKRHLNRIEDLGQAIGLERNEIRAAVDYPLDGAMTGASSKSSFLDRIVYRIICMVILFAILVVVLYSAAQPTYGFATRYGSISPNDFK